MSLTFRPRHRAFTRVHTAHYGAMLAYFRRRTTGAAEELTNDVFLRAWKSFDQLRDESEALPWLYAFARNVLMEHYRNLYKDRDHLDYSTEPEAIVPEFTTMVDMNLDLARALKTLSPTDQEILTLLAWEQLTPQEIATVLSISPNLARVKIHRARQRLEQVFNHEDSNS